MGIKERDIYEIVFMYAYMVVRRKSDIKLNSTILDSGESGSGK